MAGTDKDTGLRRLGGGRWQTRDARFTIEPQSGTWVVVDADQTDDLGLPLVRGPFASLTAAKAAIAGVRDAPTAFSPLPARATALRDRAAPETTPRSKGSTAPPRAPTPPLEPRWIGELPADDRRRARRLVAALAEAGAADPEGIARRDIAGNVASTAAFAMERAVRALGLSATPEQVVGILREGRDDGLAVRWRLVDGEGRPIGVGLAEPPKDP